MPVNLANAVYPGALANYIGCTIDPHASSSSAAVALNTSQYNLGLVRVSPTTNSITNPMFGNTVTAATNTTKVVFNTTTASVGATHSWAALLDMSGVCQAVTADGGATQWSLGLTTLSFVTPPGTGYTNSYVNLVPGALYYIALFNNGGTAPKLSGIGALLPEHTAGQSANVTAPYGFATNATSPGTTPPAVGASVLNLARNVTTGVTGGFFAGLL
jgi:hypothetical protein